MCAVSTADCPTSGNGGNGGNGNNGRRGRRQGAGHIGGVQPHDEPYPFRDPCTTSFGGRLWDSSGAMADNVWGEAVHYADMAEIAIYTALATVAAGAAEAARRGGGDMRFFWPGAVFGAGGAAVTAAKGVSKYAGHAVAVVAGGLTVAVVYDAATANDHCEGE